MNWKTTLLGIFLTFLIYPLKAQTPCTTLGQTPQTAFPVCGTDTFSQSTVPYCGGNVLPGNCAPDGVSDMNPFWYKFTCFTGGTLGFVITPNDLADDYDWELFDVTGHNPADVYTNTSLFVACNWSGNVGLTGASGAGSSLINCAGTGYPTFSARPTLIAGHQYLLLISHFTTFSPSQNGYRLSFGGGTAMITDTLTPDLVSAAASCSATQVTVALNKPMRCNSLDADGSDFTLNAAPVSVTGATGNGCSTGFDMDSVTLNLNAPLAPGNYTLTVNSGTDGNTILDVCGNGLQAGKNLNLLVPVLQPTPMDSITPVGCSPDTLQLVFSKNILCSTIAADGSDFLLSGPSAVRVTGAIGSCSAGLTRTIHLVLSGPLVVGGNYQIQLVRGSDGNTLIDQCGQETPAGSTLGFAARDTLSAGFTYHLGLGCITDTIYFFYNRPNDASIWRWTLDSLGNSQLRNPVGYFNSFNDKHISLFVSNGVCSDSTSLTIPLTNYFHPAFSSDSLICPEDTAAITNQSTGQISSYLWNFGDGSTDTLRDPPAHHYPVTNSEIVYTVQLIAGNSIGCKDTAIRLIRVLKSCYIAVPNAFTPNGDGVNDYLYPLNAYKATHLFFNVYNRLGGLVFHSTDWTSKWDGTVKGIPQDSGVYVWTLEFTNRDTGQRVFQKGSTVLIR